MKKLLSGIAEFRRTRRPEYAETFARLALGQKPDALFIACSDSRVVPNLFASTEPGDLFVLRNVGNIICPCGGDGRSTGDDSEAAAIEFALGTLRVSDIIVCGHSECGAMHALHSKRAMPDAPHVERWIRHSRPALSRLEQERSKPGDLPPHDRLSQINVLLQLEHLQTYPIVQQSMHERGIRLHGWWFDIGRLDVLAFDRDENAFVLLDDNRVDRYLSRIS